MAANHSVVTGVENAAAQTASKPVKPSRGAPGVQEKPKRDMVQKLKDGVTMKVLKAGEKM